MTFFAPCFYDKIKNLRSPKDQSQGPLGADKAQRDAKIFKAHLPNGKGSRQSCTCKPLTKIMALSEQITRAFCPKGQSEVMFSLSRVSCG